MKDISTQLNKFGFTTTIKTVLVETDIYLIVLEPATGRNQADYPAKKYEYQCPFRTGLK